MIQWRTEKKENKFKIRSDMTRFCCAFSHKRFSRVFCWCDKMFFYSFFQTPFSFIIILTFTFIKLKLMNNTRPFNTNGLVLKSKKSAKNWFYV